MGAESRTIEGPRARFERWEPEKQLRHVSQEEARFSRGFFAADPLAWFPNLGDFWRPIFHSLATDVIVTGVRKAAKLPPGLDSYALTEFDGEKGLTALSLQGVGAVVEPIVPGCPEEARGIIVEYLQRRLIATFAKAWAGVDAINCYFVKPGFDEEVPISAALELSLLIDGTPCSFWFGLGARAVEKLDGAWRLMLLQANLDKGENVLSDHVYRVGIELTELAVPPAMLIDYMRSGTIIDLEIPVSSAIHVKVDDELWAEGELCQFRNTTAVQITSTAPVLRTFPEGTTRVRVEIAQTELDRESLLEQGQLGAILLSDTPVSNHASLIISGENVATALVGMIDGRFALKVLPK